MPFEKGQDKNRAGGRPKGSKNKSRCITDWSEITDKYSELAVLKAVELLRKGSEAGKRDIACYLLETHKKILAGKVSVPDDFKAAVLRHSAEATDTLVGMLRSKSVAEATKKIVVKFFMANSMEVLSKEDSKPTKEVDTTIPVISLVALGGKKVSGKLDSKPEPKAPITPIKNKSFTLTKV